MQTKKTIIQLKVIPIICTILCISNLLNAQNLAGEVFDEYRIPLIGVYVENINSEHPHHTHTREFGDFILEDVHAGDTIQVTFFGFENQFIIIENPENELIITLKEKTFDLDEIVVGQDIKSINFITDIDIKTNPVQSSQEILRKVPGLFIGQHAGGGKAEQIFLRGFDIDHGTDIAISVSGMPVNMVSHAHGQGYADLHFVTPEVIESIDFGKGPYYTDKGNFATAGYVDFELKERLKSNMFSIEAGRFNTFRNVASFNLLQTEKHNAYAAAEYLITDGPFESSQNFSRLNMMAKYTGRLEKLDKISVLLSHFTSRWDASGQIPERVVDTGQISRFGAIDDTEGGYTGRTNIALDFTKSIDNNTFIKNNLYYSLYDFELYSNFTFFLNDPINGDQIRQKEDRQIFGIDTEWNRITNFDNSELLFQVGMGVRYDDINGNELSRTLNRKTTLTQIQFGDVDESNIFAYLNAEYEAGNWLINPGLRLDYFKFNYTDKLNPTYKSESQSTVFPSPKLNIVYSPDRDVQFFFKTGVGFHSNDTRLVLNPEEEDILPAAYGADIGTIWKPIPRMVVNTALWYLFLQQEFVYVGDEGVVEPSGKTRRLGVDFNLRYQFLDWLFADADMTYTYARSIEEEVGSQYIPLAPITTVTGGLNMKKDKLYGGINVRYLADRAANEDNSIVAEGYLITDLNIGYQFKNLSVGIDVENLFDVDWNEAQFATESRLFNEPQPIEEIHFTPGTPFYIKGSVKYEF